MLQSAVSLQQVVHRTIAFVVVFAAAQGLGAGPVQARDAIWACALEGQMLYTDEFREGCIRADAHGLGSFGKEGNAVWAEPMKQLPPATAEPRQPSASLPSATCDDYREWIALNRRTLGGTQNQTTEDRNRYARLSKQFLMVDVPSACLEPGLVDEGR